MPKNESSQVLLRADTIYISGNIDDDTVAEFCKKMVNHTDKVLNIVLVGTTGQFSSVSAIIDMLQQHKFTGRLTHINTFVAGRTSMPGTLIWLAGDKRYAGKLSVFELHLPFCEHDDECESGEDVRVAMAWIQSRTVMPDQRMVEMVGSIYLCNVYELASIGIAFEIYG